MKYSVIIPVYKNKKLFLDNLRINYPLIEDHEIIVVDDASNDNIAQELTEAFPKIKVLVNERNLGFGPTVNRGVSESSGDILILLNTDVRLQKPFDFDNEFSSDENLFAISFAQIEKDNSITGKNRLFFRNGFVEHSKASDATSGQNSWAEGGSTAMRASYFEKLGGFNDIYAPFYWEDIDLSYRAYKHNWHVLFNADYIVEHHHESTIGTYFSRIFIKKIAYRNQLFFIWMNIHDTSMMVHHILAVPVQIVRTLLKSDFSFVVALGSAMLVLPKIISIRAKNAHNSQMTDQSVFDTLELTKNV